MGPRPPARPASQRTDGRWLIKSGPAQKQDLLLQMERVGLESEPKPLGSPLGKLSLEKT